MKHFGKGRERELQHIFTPLWSMRQHEKRLRPMWLHAWG
jgi:hypothetical protein